MKKRYIMTVLLILFTAILSVSFVSAWGWGAFECQGFNLEQPEGVELASGYSPTSPPHNVKLVEKGGDTNWKFLCADLSEVPLDGLPDNMSIVDNHTESGLTIIKGQIIGDVSYDFTEGDNITYVEFDKEGKQFYLAINHRYTDLDKIDLPNDVKLAQEIKESIKLK